VGRPCPFRWVVASKCFDNVKPEILLDIFSLDREFGIPNKEGTRFARDDPACLLELLGC
jgi:hypothetical protein